MKRFPLSQAPKCRQTSPEDRRCNQIDVINVLLNAYIGGDLSMEAQDHIAVLDTQVEDVKGQRLVVRFRVIR